MRAEKLKLELSEIKKYNYVINCDGLYYTYALDMLNHIGTTDEILRDDLIYDIFSKWIIQNRFSNKEIQTLLDICIDEDHLMKGIGAENDDTVFTRTFSALIIALIIYYHNQNNFLPYNTIVKVKNIMADYYNKEMDLRGYIDNKGWAHSVAHGADVIDELAQCSVLCKEDLKDLLMALESKICQGKYVYIDGEPDRISIAVKSIVMRDEIDGSDILLWLESFKKYDYRNNSSIEWYHQSVNVVNFLKSLYFILKAGNKDIIILDKIQDLITNLL